MLSACIFIHDGVYNNNAGGEMPGGITKAQALAYCEDVISSGKYKLESDFKKLWPAACAKSSKQQKQIRNLLFLPTTMKQVKNLYLLLSLIKTKIIMTVLKQTETVLLST